MLSASPCAEFTGSTQAKSFAACRYERVNDQAEIEECDLLEKPRRIGPECRVPMLPTPRLQNTGGVAHSSPVAAIGLRRSRCRDPPRACIGRMKKFPSAAEIRALVLRVLSSEQPLRNLARRGGSDVPVAAVADDEHFEVVPARLNQFINQPVGVSPPRNDRRKERHMTSGTCGANKRAQS